MQNIPRWMTLRLEIAQDRGAPGGGRKAWNTGRPNAARSRRLGLPVRTGLPDNDAVEDAVRDYIALFCADTQPGELAALRRLAVVWMARLADFRPHLGGGRLAWHGDAVVGHLHPVVLR
jgi:hypothetical protein